MGQLSIEIGDKQTVWGGFKCQNKLLGMPWNLCFSFFVFYCSMGCYQKPLSFKGTYRISLTKLWLCANNFIKNVKFNDENVYPHI